MLVSLRYRSLPWFASLLGVLLLLCVVVGHGGYIIWVNLHVAVRIGRVRHHQFSVLAVDDAQEDRLAVHNATNVIGLVHSRLVHCLSQTGSSQAFSSTKRRNGGKHPRCLDQKSGRNGCADSCLGDAKSKQASLGKPPMERGDELQIGKVLVH